MVVIAAVIHPESEVAQNEVTVGVGSRLARARTERVAQIVHRGAGRGAADDDCLVHEARRQRRDARLDARAEAGAAQRVVVHG